MSDYICKCYKRDTRKTCDDYHAKENKKEKLNGNTIKEKKCVLLTAGNLKEFKKNKTQEMIFPQLTHAVILNKISIFSSWSCGQSSTWKLIDKIESWT